MYKTESQGQTMKCMSHYPSQYNNNNKLNNILNWQETYCPKYGRWSVIEGYPCKSEVTDLELAVSIC